MWHVNREVALRSGVRNARETRAGRAHGVSVGRARAIHRDASARSGRGRRAAGRRVRRRRRLRGRWCARQCRGNGLGEPECGGRASLHAARRPGPGEQNQPRRSFVDGIHAGRSRPRISRRAALEPPADHDELPVRLSRPSGCRCPFVGFLVGERMDRARHSCEPAGCGELLARLIGPEHTRSSGAGAVLGFSGVAGPVGWRAAFACYVPFGEPDQKGFVQIGWRF